MPTTRLTVSNDVGLHARPAAQFAKAAAAFASDLRLRKGDGDANAKSLLSILALGVDSGDTIELVAEGPDAEQALAELTALVDQL